MPRSAHHVARPLAAALAVVLGAGILSLAQATDAPATAPTPGTVTAAVASPAVTVEPQPSPGPTPTTDSTVTPAPPTTATPPATATPPTTAAPAPTAAPPTTTPTTTTPATTAPPTTAPPTTAAPVTTTTAAPAPASPPAAAQQESTVQRVERAFQTAVPASWRAAVPTRFELIEGNTSWANSDGLIQVGSSHANGDLSHLMDVLAHEFGHLIAFDYGSQAYAGAGPAGWPAPPQRPEEAWADCVQRAFTGRDNPSHGLASCSGESFAWAADWLGQGPSAHARTR